MEVTAKYDWKGNLSGYQWGDMAVPRDEGNQHYQLIKEAIANGTCVVNEPAIEEVTAAYNQKGNLSGYRFGSIFVPIDESNQLYQRVKEAIVNGTCKVNDSPHGSENKPIIESIVFCIFFDRPWQNINNLYEGKIPYRSNNSQTYRDYTFRLINLPFAEKINKFHFLFEYHKIKKEQFPMDLPLKFGLLELEVPSKYLQKLFKNEKLLLDKDRSNFLEDSLNQHLKETGRSINQGADIRWSINNAKCYLENFIMEIGNRVTEAYTREFGELPIGYIDRWKVYEETIVINKYQDGSFGIGTFGLQGKQNLHLSGEWRQQMSLLQVSQPEEYPTPPQINALRRVRMLVKTGLHMEALCLLNAFIEVNIRDVLINCIKSNPEGQNQILKLDHKVLLEMLQKINQGADNDLFRRIDYLNKINAAKEILARRNAYIHRLSTTKRTIERPEMNKYSHQLDLIKKEQILTINQRRELEKLMHGFMDEWESHLWLGIQARLASGEDAAAIKIIQQFLERKFPPKAMFRWLKPLVSG